MNHPLPANYVNLSETLIELLGTLKGAPLSFMLAIGLHEPAICLRGADPLTIPAISRLTNYSRRAVIYAADYLGEHYLTTEGRNACGQRTFRPATYIWFGGKRYSPHAATFPIPGGDPNPSSEIKPDAENNTSSVQPVQSPVVVGTAFIPLSALKEQQQPPIHAEDVPPEPAPDTRLILGAAGIGEPSLSRLACRVRPLDALDWYLWIQYVQPRPRNPQGVAVAALTVNAEALPTASEAQLDKWFQLEHRRIVHDHECVQHRWWCRMNWGCEQCGITGQRAAD